MRTILVCALYLIKYGIIRSKAIRAYYRTLCIVHIGSHIVSDGTFLDTIMNTIMIVIELYSDLK
jgi:hypothetical protein